MFIKFSSITLFILCHVICLTEDVPGGQKNSNTLTVEQAAEMAKKANVDSVLEGEKQKNA